MDFTLIYDVWRTLISLIDKMVYWFMELLISIFSTIAKVQLFSTGDGGIVEKFADRLYVLIAIIMVFKVSFSIIQYIINPDTFSDKERGMGKVVQSVLLVLVALVGVRYVFNIAYDLQDKVVKNNTIEKIVLGINANTTMQDNIQKELPFHVLSAFVRPTTSEAQASFDTFKKQGDYWKLLDHVNDKSSGNSSAYIYDYKWLISTLAGAFVVIIYLNFCIDLAIRAAKFGFLQLIAPIPIISMVDPKSSKNGMMSKWVKECINTYLGLFIRIAAVSFVIFLVDIIMKDNLLDSSVGDLKIYINLILIFGALMFAKDLPKMITDLTGVDLKGNFKLNPFKRVTEDPLAGKLVAGSLGVAGGVAANALGAFSNIKNAKGAGKIGAALGTLPSMVAGGVSAGARGLFSTEKNGLKAARTGIKGATDARNLRDRRKATETFTSDFSKLGGDIANWAGIDAAAVKYDKQIEEYSQVGQKSDEILKRANSEMIKYEKIKFKDSDGNNIDMRKFKIAKENLNSLRNVDTSKMTKNQLSAHNARIVDLQTYVAMTEKLGEQAYINYVQQGIVYDQDPVTGKDRKIEDSQVSDSMAELSRVVSRSSDKTVSKHQVVTGKDVKTLKDAMDDAKIHVKSDKRYERAQINKKNDAKK